MTAISVVVPTYRRPDALRRVLAGYARQHPATPEFEVVVIDDGSGDGTAQWLADFDAKRFRLRFATQANAGPAVARNHALDLVVGSLVLFTGDDIEPAGDLLLRHWRAHQELADPGVAVLGLTRWTPREPLTATMRHIDGVGAEQFSYLYMKHGASYDFRHFYTSNVSVRRALIADTRFAEVFPAAAFEDADFAHRLCPRGLRIVYRTEAVGFHEHPYDARGFYRRQLRCGAMAAILHRRFPQLGPLLAIPDLSHARIERLRAGRKIRDRIHTVEARLDELETRAIALATFYDRLDPPGIDPVLTALFRYAYQAGLADALLGPEAARRVRAERFRALVPPAVERFVERVRSHGLPVPAADSEALAAAAHLT